MAIISKAWSIGNLPRKINITDYGVSGGSIINTALALAIADLTDNTELHFPEGVYYIDDTAGAARTPNGLNGGGYSTPTFFTIQNLNNLKITGPGKIVCNGTKNFVLFDFVNINGFEIEGLKIQGNRDSSPSDILFFAIAGDLIRIRGNSGSFSRNVRISNCHLSYAPISPLRIMRAVEDVTIVDNVFSDNNSAIRFGEAAAGLPLAQVPRRIVFTGNTVSGNICDGCVQVRYNCEDVTISGNHINIYKGDDVFEYVNDNTATLGTPVHSTGIDIRGGIAGQTYVNNINISGNTIKAISSLGYVSRGISLLDTAGYEYANNVTVVGNKIYGTMSFYGDGHKITGNTIYGNVTKDGTTGYIEISSNNIIVPPARSMTIVSNSVAASTVVTTASNHNLFNGQTVRISGSNSTPSINGDRVATVLSPTTFSIPVTTTVAGNTGTVSKDYDMKAVFVTSGTFRADILNNTIDTPADTSILSANCSHQVIKGNVINYTGSATANLNRAINCGVGLTVHIESNTIVNADGSGVAIASTGGAGALLTIADNQVKAAGNRGVQVLSGATAGTLYIRGNDIGLAALGDYLNQGTLTTYVYPDNSWVKDGGIKLVSVKTFGAKGDGTTDDTAAIQAAVNYIKANATSGIGQATLYFPETDSNKSYIVSDQILFQDMIQVRVTGGQGSHIRNNTTSDPIFHFEGTVGFGNVFGFHVDNLFLANQYTSNTEGAIKLTRCILSWFTDIYIDNNNCGYGIYMDSSSAENFFDNIVVEQAGIDGVYCNSDLNNFSNIGVKGCGRYGINIDSNARGNNLTGITSYLSGQHGIYCIGQNNVLTSLVARNNSTTSSNTYDGIQIGGTDNIVSSVNAYDDQGSPTQRYGITVAGTRNKLHSYQGSGNATRLVSSASSTAIISDLNIPGIGTSIGDVDATFTPGVSNEVQRCTVPITANRTHTLGTTGMMNGHRFTIIRSTASTGAFTIDVGGLTTLATGQWCEVMSNGSNWVLIKKGSLT